MRFSNIRASLLVIGALTLGSSCSKDPVSPKDDLPGLSSIISGMVTDGGVTAALRSGALPIAGTGPQTTTAPSITMVNGGTSGLSFHATQPFSSLLLAVDGVDDYYQVNLPAAVTSTQLLVTFSQTLNRGAVPIMVMASDGHSWGAVTRINAAVIQVGSGAVQVSLSWDASADLDLHVHEPSGEEVYYANRESDTGGRIDLDSNASCSLDHRNNENITWPEESAPRGTYQVYVDNWSSCDKSPINFVVTVTVKGQQPKLYTGQFADPGDRGINGSGRLVATFTY